MKQRTILFLLGLLFICCGQLVAQSPAPVTLVKAARLLDPRTGNVLSPAAVLIENAKIKEVGAPTKVQAPSGAKVVDLGSATLLPGLITGHAHLLLDVVLPTEAERARHDNGTMTVAELLAIGESPSKRVLLGAHDARDAGAADGRRQGVRLSEEARRKRQVPHQGHRLPRRAALA